ncbi:hypothetical protein EPUS_08249 [Endocarpon pusillum Z07020]|uniref:Uncharacterized protein n=1 Tax=Endocarpon pusillum (strain Z07020 / HMAS-L-300199) TaxID=1263415 RepID=U1HYN6_ENDPU|nr:uncharacterized protein EPUS_08249 [Endocarpon pusillum Z07020]ERF75995.1 hypothetical protein EPUS_08249 [Endocarpon pusillum Z07020]
MPGSDLAFIVKLPLLTLPPTTLSHHPVRKEHIPSTQLLRAHIDLDIDISSSPAPAPVKMVCPISVTKFVGTISLGLLTKHATRFPNHNACHPTDVPAPGHLVQHLRHHAPVSRAPPDTASSASRTLAQIQTATTRHVLTFASVSSLSLITCYSLASARGKHPYLLWTALMAFLAGQGLEYYYNGLDRFPTLRKSASSDRGARSYVMVGDEDEASVNGEKVEMEMSRERRVQAVRALVSGLGFAMGVVGIWGDGS